MIQKLEIIHIKEALLREIRALRTNVQGADKRAEIAISYRLQPDAFGNQIFWCQIGGTTITVENYEPSDKKQFYSFVSWAVQVVCVGNGFRNLPIQMHTLSSDEQESDSKWFVSHRIEVLAKPATQFGKLQKVLEKYYQDEDEAPARITAFDIYKYTRMQDGSVQREYAAHDAVWCSHVAGELRKSIRNYAGVVDLCFSSSHTILSAEITTPTGKSHVLEFTY